MGMNDKLRQLLEKQYKRYRMRMIYLEHHFKWPWEMPVKK